MKRYNKWSVRMTAMALTGICLLGGVALAASSAGSVGDPLVSYSYFAETILPNLLSDVEGKAEDVADDLRADFDDQLATYTDEVEALAAELAAQSGSGGSTAAAYTVLTLAAGESIALDAGDEVLLRIGSATVSGGSPALINTTAGTELANGGSLVANNLYLCTINGRTLTAGGSTTWILLRS